MRISPNSISTCPWFLRPFFWSQRRKYGVPLEASLVWSRVPRLFIAVAHLYGVIDRRKSPISPALRSLATVRVSQINGCHFCIDVNTATLLRRGVPLDKAEALADWRSSPLFDKRERDVLDYAEAMTDSRNHVTDTHISRLKHHFDEQGIIELTALIAFQNLSSKFNVALDVPPQGFCSVAMLGGKVDATPRDAGPETDRR